MELVLFTLHYNTYATFQSNFDNRHCILVPVLTGGGYGRNPCPKRHRTAQRRKRRRALNGNDSLTVGTLNEYRKYRSILSIDLGFLPSNITITSVQLSLTSVARASGGPLTINLFELAQDFDIDTATWNSSSVIDGVKNEWDTAGGSYTPTILASQDVTMGNDAQEYFWSSVALTALTASAYDSDSPLLLLLRATDAVEAQSTRQLAWFYSSENGSMAPKLQIEYSVNIPEASTYVLTLGVLGLAASVTTLHYRRKTVAANG
ncbi:DNRLRE domain-containing protein [Ruficoccus amylovorans]|uniref:DNRLRE domain-containing protein n=1 Tax=Ruficoccus amylovorans TaxID=1804625 RepID=A0A842HGH6_9BACT|nr:DNRLRE domain-containing protein [Ruficoccus amylovorans]